MILFNVSSMVFKYGSINLCGSVFYVVNKEGRDLFELSAEADKEGRDIVIPAGEPADLCRVDLVPAYRFLGRDLFLSLVDKGKSAEEIKSIINLKKRK